MKRREVSVSSCVYVEGGKGRREGERESGRIESRGQRNKASYRKFRT